MEKDERWKKKQHTNLQLQEALASERFRENSRDQVKALKDTQKDTLQNPKELRKRQKESTRHRKTETILSSYHCKCNSSTFKLSDSFSDIIELHNRNTLVA